MFPIIRASSNISPLLYIIYDEAMIKDASEEQVYGIIKIGGKIVNAVRFADDEAITASSRTRANDESS